MPTGTLHESLEALREHNREVDALARTQALLSWDQHVFMPPGGREGRAQQVALLSTLAHGRKTDPALGALLRRLAQRDDLDSIQAVAVRQMTRDYQHDTARSSELVATMARARSRAFGAWTQAKEANDFSIFSPHMETLLDLSRQEAEALSTDGQSPYDALLEQFDPGISQDVLDPLFERLATGLRTLLSEIADRDAPAPLSGTFPIDAQRALSRDVVEALGYEFSRGRLDESPHPCTISIGRDDVRITTRFDDRDLLSGLGATLHEAGHAVYEQGLPVEWIPLGLAKAASCGLHESQSRLWENFVGRSRAFCTWAAPRIHQHFPDVGVTPEILYAACNRVEAGPIRVEADELTYNLHIIVRYRLEQQLVNGDLSVPDLPEAWNAAYREMLGIEPATATVGVLQDVHWAMLSFGYFPSYTLGNLYAASLGRTLETAHTDLWERIADGDFSMVLSWLRTHIHERGRSANASEIVSDATGQRDMVADLLAHLRERMAPLYGLD